jgi:L-alanine-DL-glutamate epimerase-like enolase superfamily enzyme
MNRVEEVARRFGANILFDPHQAILLAQQLAARGLTLFEMPFTGPNCNKMASALLQAFRERRIDLYRDADGDRLIDDLGRLTIVEKSFGYKLEASHDPNTGHADRAFALAIALPAALEAAMTYTPDHQYESYGLAVP